MNYKDFNEHRYKRKKEIYRFVLGLQELFNYPVLNIIWIVYVSFVKLLIWGEKWIAKKLNVIQTLEPILRICTKLLLVIISLILALAIIQGIGYLFAVKDEADLEIVFGDKRNVKNQCPILIYKKKDKKTKVIKREFYTTIPMERWQEKKESICDIMNIYLLDDFSYGGRKKDKGNRVYFESFKGRKPINRGVLYDEEF